MKSLTAIVIVDIIAIRFMRRFGQKENEFASVDEFRNAMDAIAQGPPPRDHNPAASRREQQINARLASRGETAGQYMTRWFVEEATRPIREIQAAHEAPLPPIIPEPAEHGLTQLTMADIQLRTTHHLGTIIHPYKR